MAGFLRVCGGVHRACVVLYTLCVGHRPRVDISLCVSTEAMAFGFQSATHGGLVKHHLWGCLRGCLLRGCLQRSQYNRPSYCLCTHFIINGNLAQCRTYCLGRTAPCTQSDPHPTRGHTTYPLKHLHLTVWPTFTTPR